MILQIVKTAKMKKIISLSVPLRRGNRKNRIDSQNQHQKKKTRVIKRERDRRLMIRNKKKHGR